MDQYLNYFGFQLSSLHSEKNEGYMTHEQQKQFNDFLARHVHIKSVLEIGLNGGHSAENFFQNCKNLEKFLSFDICMHKYTPVAVEYLARKYKEKFAFIEGDSSLTLPEYAKNSKEKFDLIYIDGNHSYDNCIKDILNCQNFATESTILLIDIMLFGLKTL